MTAHEKLIIIGTGPAGCTAAIYAARANLAPLVLTGSLTAGGALMTTTDVENFPGFPDGIAGPDLVEAMAKQAERFGARIEYDDVATLDARSTPKTLTTASGATYTADAVILATGSAYRHLDVPGEERLAGRGVSYCATCDGFFFRDKDIVVVGGGDSALTEATFLTRYANKVTVVHRRDELRASQIMIDRANADPKIDFIWNAEVTAIGGQDAVTAVTLRDTITGRATEVATDAVFVAIGHTPRSELIAGQVDLDWAANSGLAESTRTDVDGVFACGDLTDHTYRQAITAAASGCRAALTAQDYLAGLTDVRLAH